MKTKCKEIAENHTNLCLILLFILGIILYGAISKIMTNPIFLNNDEELYVNMARAFFFEHNFSRGYELVNYSCVLYSILISIAYFFYSPENIVFIMRMIGVIAMTSSIFPVYLLSKRVLGSKTKALAMSALTLIIPEMVSSVYLIQENLSYPIFLWIAYFVYCKFTSDNKATVKYDVVIIMLLALIFFVKSYAIIFAVAYFLCLFLDILHKKEYKKIKTLVVEGIAFILLMLLGLLLVKSVNGFQEGTNHYASQISSIFPITFSKIRLFYIWSILLFTFLPILYGHIASNASNLKYKAL